MELTEKILKQLILEALEDESPLEGMIRSGRWEAINQALSLTVDFGLPLEELPWNLLPLDTMAREDLAELGQYLQDNTEHSDRRVHRLLRIGIKGLKNTDPNANPMDFASPSRAKKYAIGAIKKILGIPLRDRN